LTAHVQTTQINTVDKAPARGRDHLGIVGGIILEWVGGIVGIRTKALPLSPASSRLITPSLNSRLKLRRSC